MIEIVEMTLHNISFSLYNERKTILRDDQMEKLESIR